jgi:hypothetical protein
MMPGTSTSFDVRQLHDLTILTRKDVCTVKQTTRQLVANGSYVHSAQNGVFLAEKHAEKRLRATSVCRTVDID